jgi:glycosyltransferase involved in cell wall biosynthesis
VTPDRRALRILRVVRDYWPAFGGNERWSLQHDWWFSEVAGDQVQVVVLRPGHHLDHAPHRDAFMRLPLPGTFDVPGLPKVKAYHELLPEGRGFSLARAYRERLRPWVEQTDVIVTQMHHWNARLAWDDKPAVLEPGWPVSCTVGYGTSPCPRGRFTCRKCLRERGLRWLVRDGLQRAALARFDLAIGTEVVRQDFQRVGLGSRHHLVRHLVTPSRMHDTPNTDALRQALVQLADLAARGPVLMQFNRLQRFKNPGLLLDVVERLPECGVAFAGDGIDRTALEERVRTTPALRGRVLFLGLLPANMIGVYAAHASAFVLTSDYGNYNTSLFELMSLGVAPAVAVGTPDFPQEFLQRRLVETAPNDAGAIAAAVRGLLADAARRTDMVQRAKAYVAEHHGDDQMWRYRDRLRELVDGGRRRA